MEFALLVNTRQWKFVKIAPKDITQIQTGYQHAKDVLPASIRKIYNPLPVKNVLLEGMTTQIIMLDVKLQHLPLVAIKYVNHLNTKTKKEKHHASHAVLIKYRLSTQPTV